MSQIAAFLYPLLVLVSLLTATTLTFTLAAGVHRGADRDGGDRLADHRRRRGDGVRGDRADRDVRDPRDGRRVRVGPGDGHKPTTSRASAGLKMQRCRNAQDSRPPCRSQDSRELKVLARTQVPRLCRVLPGRGGHGAHRHAAGQCERGLHDAEAEVELDALPDGALRRGLGRRAQFGHVHRVRQQRSDPAVGPRLPLPRSGDRARCHQRTARGQHERHRCVPAALTTRGPQGRVDTHGQAPDLPSVVGQPPRHLLRADPPARPDCDRRRDR